MRDLEDSAMTPSSSITPTWAGVCVEVGEIANSFLHGRSHIKLLEAGCGSASHVRFKANAYVVGVDISREQLEQNDTLQEKILGDIQHCLLPEEEFDVVVCWMVLEHLSKPKEALRNLFRAVKPQGLLILAFPNLLSIKGAVTKITPFWFHEVFYKFMKYTSRHFPTYLRVAILPKNVTRLAHDNGFSVEYGRLVEDPIWNKVRSRFRFVDLTFSAMESLTRFISFGKVQSPLRDNCALILRKHAKSY